MDICYQSKELEWIMLGYLGPYSQGILRLKVTLCDDILR